MMLINVLGKLLQHIIPPITNHESIEEKKSHENLDHINLYICIDITYFTGFQYIYIYILREKRTTSQFILKKIVTTTATWRRRRKQTKKMYYQVTVKDINI